MQTVTLSDATARLSELCETVERTGEPVQITRQGRPVAVIARWKEPSVWAAREHYERQHGPLADDFEIPARSVDERTGTNPLD
jgi:prevent-host-death family protein